MRGSASVQKALTEPQSEAAAGLLGWPLWVGKTAGAPALELEQAPWVQAPALEVHWAQTQAPPARLALTSSLHWVLGPGQELGPCLARSASVALEARAALGAAAGGWGRRAKVVLAVFWVTAVVVVIAATILFCWAGQQPPEPKPTEAQLLSARLRQAGPPGGPWKGPLQHRGAVRSPTATSLTSSYTLNSSRVAYLTRKLLRAFKVRAPFAPPEQALRGGQGAVLAVESTLSF